MQLEMVRRLKRALETAEASTGRLNRRLLTLTWVITGFTVVMGVPPILDFLRWLGRLR